MAIKIHPSLAMHAGKWLQEEIVKPAHIPTGKLAKGLSISSQVLSTILNGQAPLTARIAIRFEKAFGIKADTLMRMQIACDLAQARMKEEKTFIPSTSSSTDDNR